MGEFLQLGNPKINKIKCHSHKTLDLLTLAKSSCVHPHALKSHNALAACLFLISKLATASEEETKYVSFYRKMCKTQPLIQFS
jgi:hypothetical protein